MRSVASARVAGEGPGRLKRSIAPAISPRYRRILPASGEPSTVLSAAIADSARARSPTLTSPSASATPERLA